MKIDLKFPGGGELHIEHEPMSGDRFFGVCCMAVLLGGLLFFLILFSILK